jgi:hypothetical protein
MSDADRRKKSEPVAMDSVSEVLGQVVRESRTDLRPAASNVDWARVEEALLARVAAARSEEAALARFRGSWMWGAFGGVAAVAAAAAIVLGHGADRAVPAYSSDRAALGVAQPSAAKDDVTSTLAGRQGEGELLVGKAGSPASPATAHSRIGAGTVVETHKARALWDATGHATWLLEEDSRVAVKGSSPLVLSLERGAVEAQVVPVPSGEAFAVDVGQERIAVHGTHLRIAREGDGITVDLSEGVISIGRPPRAGSTYGTLVVAPAHVEFGLADVTGSMRVTHDASAVRPAASFTALTESVAARAAHAAPQSNSGQPPAGAHPAVATPGNATRATGAHGTGSADTVAVDPRGEESISSAVRGCAADALHSTDVTVTVNSSLELTVGDDGFVRTARFTPPLAPEIQKCATAAIYKTRFADAGVRKIDIVLQR